MKRSKAFTQMVKTATELGWPEHFTDDLYVHDQDFVNTANKKHFGWIVRQCGTQIIVFDSEFCKIEAEYYKQYFEDGKAFYFFVSIEDGTIIESNPNEIIGCCLDVLWEKRREATT